MNAGLGESPGSVDCSRHTKHKVREVDDESGLFSVLVGEEARIHKVPAKYIWNYDDDAPLTVGRLGNVCREFGDSLNRSLRSAFMNESGYASWTDSAFSHGKLWG